MRTHGTISYDSEKGLWALACEPHVTLRLRRVFGKLNKASYGTHYLSDTPENAYDLKWFLDRYPMKIEKGAEILDARARAHVERTKLVDQLVGGRVEAQAFDLAEPAREYQRIAAAMTLATGGLLLADDVGLGKTLSAICTFTDPRTLPALVVTLTHLPSQWESEIKRFAPRLTTHKIKQGRPYDVTQIGRRRNLQPNLPGAMPDVLLINYHKLAGWAETLAGVVRSIVFDECQELRTGPKSGKYNAAQFIASQCAFRMGLSATPIYNYGAEFFNVLNCIRPGALGDYGEFLREWCGGWSSITEPRAFGSYVRESGLMLRRTRKDVSRELPSLTKAPHKIDANTAALERVSASCAELAKLILKQGESHRGEKMMASEELSNKLRQATGIAKAPFVAEFVKLLVESGEKVVLLGWHREVYSIWMDSLRDLKPALYSGSESPREKDIAKDRFMSDETNVLIMSLRSGAGLDGLQAKCRTVVFGELDWSPGVHEQCTGRIHRDGQPDPVIAYYLIADSGADPIIADVLGLKKQQIDGLRDPDAELVKKLEVDTGHVRRLAEGFLAQQGITIKEIDRNAEEDYTQTEPSGSEVFRQGGDQVYGELSHQEPASGPDVDRISYL
jgi:SNF2 family DNA or RNA helicase